MKKAHVKHVKAVGKHTVGFPLPGIIHLTCVLFQILHLASHRRHRACETIISRHAKIVLNQVDLVRKKNFVARITQSIQYSSAPVLAKQLSSHRFHHTTATIDC